MSSAANLGSQILVQIGAHQGGGEPGQIVTVDQCGELGLVFRQSNRSRTGHSLGVAARGIGRDRVLAGALRILDLGVFRTGGEEYTRSNGTYGLATLQRDHVRLSGDQVRFRYLAKGGTLREVMISDAPLAALVRSLRRAGPDVDRLLAYRDGSQWREVRADEVNLRFRDLTGDDFTAKDLRTWNATVLAAAAFAEHDAPTSRRARQRVRATVMREVAEELGNTPAVARSSYVDPRVVRHFESGRTIRPALERIGGSLADEDARDAIERAVIRLLDA